MFSVKYRTQSGAVAEVVIDASNRSECVSICKSRGITAISISEKKNPEQRHRHFAIFKLGGKVALTVVILLAGYFIINDRDRPVTTKESKRKHREKSVSSHCTNSLPKILINDASDQTTTPKKSGYPTYVDEKGVLRYKNGMRVRTGEPARSFEVGGYAKKRFKYVSEEQIAGLLEIEPGTMIFGRMTYGERFVEDFKKSLEDEIEFLDTDSEYDRKLKEDVIATKKELKAALDRGEDIGKMLTESRNQLQELGQYREKLKKQFDEYRREGPKTAEELKDFVDAINVMLTESGSRPIKLSRLLLRKIEEKGETK